MCGEIVVIVETLRGQVCEITYTLLAAGRALAAGMKTKLTALLLGHEVQSFVASLGAADRIVSVDHPALSAFNPEAHVSACCAVLKDHKPRLVLLGHTAVGTDIAGALAHRLAWPLVASCKTFVLADGDPQYSAITCGGKLIASGLLPGPTCLATVIPGGYKPDADKVARSAPVEKMSAPPDLDNVRSQFMNYIEPPTGDVDIAKEPVLVSVGRGIQNPDNLALAERLAKALRGVVSASRPVVDQGWLPTTRLVGKSGKQVRPKLYLAVGISGAPEHLEGVPEAELMIAINTDPKAPIFNVANYGATCNAVELMPALAEVLGK